MRQLPLYIGDQHAPVEVAGVLQYDSACMRCPLGLSKVSTCVPPTGNGSGGIVVVAEQITAEEDKYGKQAVGNLHKYLAARVHAHGRKPFVFDVAVKCHAGQALEDAHIEACRPFLWNTLLAARPERVIVAGSHAVKSVLGRSPHLQSVRRGYGWLWDAPWAAPITLRDGRVVRPVPVFLVMHPWQSATNPIMREWLDTDLQWACTTPMPTLPPWDHVTNVVTNADDARVATERLRDAAWVTLDVETAGRMHSGELRVVSLSLATSDRDHSWVWDRYALADGEAFEELAQLLEDPTCLKVAQNAKFDLQAIEQGMGISVQGLRGDTRIWRKTLDSDSLADLGTMHELVGTGGLAREMDARVEELVVEERKKAQAVKRRILKAKPHLEQAIKGTKDQIELLLSKYGDDLTDDERRALWRGYEPRAYVYGEVETDLLSRYNAGDVVSTSLLADRYFEQLTNRDLLFVWDALWGPATEALVQVETWGFQMDVDRLKLLSRHFGMQLDLIKQRFSPYPNLNPNSPESIAELLYKQLGLKPLKKSEKTGDPSTDKESLDHLKGQHPVVDDIIEYRHIAKLKSQYADGLILHIAPDGRIHTTYNVDGARSGRASSENPNMQNIPSEERDPTDSKMIKDCFIARPGYTLIAGDYSQLEFRVAADLSDDPDMKVVFLSGVDFHQATAELIAPIVWKVHACPLCKVQGCHVTKAHRSQAKSFNFALMYGMTDNTVAENLGISVAMAKTIRAAILGKFRKFAAWLLQRLAESRKTGVAWTWWDGRKAHCRNLFKIKDQANDGARINAENSAGNTPIQGSASFYGLASVPALVQWILATPVLLRADTRVVATVHDSIVLEVRDDLLHMVAAKLDAVMRGWPTRTGVPLDVDLKMGTRWGSMVKYVKPTPAAQVMSAPAGI